MTRARKEQIAVESTPYYHCMVRCVRRAYLCGDDPLTGKNYDHRKQWAIQRLRQLASVFAINVCAYTFLSNHYHLILHIDDQQAKLWSEKEVAKRWISIFNGPPAVGKWLDNEVLDDAEQAILNAQLPVWRKRLVDISWFMRCMNEPIARLANKEDGCKGRFWEGRFKSQALLDDTALLACMSYVDLNLIRAGIAENCETSDFTSIQLRLSEYLDAVKSNSEKTQRAALKVQKRLDQQRASLTKYFEGAREGDLLLNADLPEAPLLGFEGVVNSKFGSCIPFSFKDYLQLVEDTGQIIRSDKKGFIDVQMPPILERLGIQGDNWITSIKKYGRMFSVIAGTKSSLERNRQAMNKQWVKGAKQALG